MDNENKEEVVVSKSCKKTGSIFFTIFACLMTGVIVFLATNIGLKAAKTVDPEPKCPTSNKESNVTSNVESNTTSNVASNVVSNTTSNVASNTTSNVTSNTTTVAKTYTTTELEGIYEFTYTDKSTKVLTLYKEGLFEMHVNIPVPGCPDMLFGNYTVEGNKITLFGTISYGCSCEGKKSIAKYTGTINGTNITIDKTTLAKTKAKIETSYSETLDSIISCVYQGQIPSTEEESVN